jgi:hypothetical protein
MKPNYAYAAQVPAIRLRRSRSSTSQIASPQGNGKIDGYLVKPANAPRQGVRSWS